MSSPVLLLGALVAAAAISTQARELPQQVAELGDQAYQKTEEAFSIHQDQNGTLRQDCPSLSELPIADSNLKNFYGIRYYIEPGASTSTMACNGYHFDEIAGFRETIQEGYGRIVGTLFVHHGCTFFAFSEPNYQGTMFKFAGPLTMLNVPIDAFGRWCHHDPNDVHMPCYHSMIVECEMNMPDCTPADEWSAVAYMDNSGSSLPTKFIYEYKIGTAWSNEVSQGFNVDASVTSTIKAGFFGIFEAEVSTTFSTGYNWQSTSSEAKSEEETFTIETELPGGTIIKIEQAKGTCGDSEVKTEMFRNLEITAAGEKVSHTFVH
jgi:hypothetical protein